jgi:MFS family permease
LNPRPVFIAIAVVTVGMLPVFLTGGLAVQMRADLGFGAGALGLAVAAFFASSSLASALFGRAVERIGARAGMRLAVVASAGVLLGIAFFARSWEGLFLCLLLGGLVNAVSHPATHLFLAREVPTGRQGLSFGVKQSAIPVATLLSGLAVPAVGLTVGWRWAYAGAAALALVVAFLIRYARPAYRGAGSRLDRDLPPNARTVSLMLLALGVGLGSAAATPLGAFVVESSVGAGVPAGRAGLLLALGSATCIVVRVLFGNIADHMEGGRLRIVVGMLAVGVAGFVVLASGATGALLVIGVLFAFGAGWGWPGLFNFTIVHTNPAAPAAATGITQTGASGGAALGPLLFGLAAEYTSYGTAWLLCGFLALLAGAAVLTGRALLLRDLALRA